MVEVDACPKSTLCMPRGWSPDAVALSCVLPLLRYFVEVGARLAIPSAGMRMLILLFLIFI
jgi:hypothetical protein